MIAAGPLSREPRLLRTPVARLLAVASLLSGLGLSIAAARAWGRETFGLYVYAIWVASAIGLASGAVSLASIRRFVDRSAGRQRWIRVLISGTLLGSVLGLPFFLIAYTRKMPTLWDLMIPVAILAGASLFSLLTLGVPSVSDFGARAATVAVPAVVALSATVLVLSGAGPGAVLVLLAAGHVVFAYLLLRRHGSAEIGDLFPITALALVDLIAWQESQVVFLQHHGTLADVGVFGVTFALAATTVRMVPVALKPVFDPASSGPMAATPAPDALTFRRGVIVMAAASALVALITTALGRTLLAAWGPTYPTAYPILVVLLAGLSAGNVLGVAAIAFLRTGRTRALLALGLVLAAASIAASILLIPAYGVTGAAIGCALIQGLSIPLVALPLLRGIGLRLPWASLGRLLLATAVAGALGWVLRPRFLGRTTADLVELGVSLLAFAWLYGRLGGREDVRGRAEVVDPAPPPPHEPVPEVSIVVVTKNRPGHLRTCLEQAIAQEGPSREIIVVDSSDDGATDLLLASTFPRVRRVRVRGMPHNMHFARNQGIRLARGGVVSFLDDDSFAEPGWLARIAAHFADPEIGGAGGRIIDDIFGNAPTGEIVGGLEANGRMHLNFTRHTGATIEVEHVIGCNMSFRAEALRRIGGFDLAYGGPSFMEDTDVCQRVRRAGYRFVFDPDAVVHHANAPRDSGLVRDRRFEPQVQFWSARSRAYFALKLLPWTVATLRYNALGFLKLHAQGAIAERSWGHARSFALQALGLACGVIDWVVAGFPRVRATARTLFSRTSVSRVL